MEQELLIQYLSGKTGAIKDFPFGPDVPVFKVMNKMFALISVRNDNQEMNLKCDPDYAEELRDLYEAVQPGYHMNKQHWNTVILDGSLNNDLIFQMIDESYNLVVKKLKKVEKEELKRLEKSSGE